MQIYIRSNLIIIIGKRTSERTRRHSQRTIQTQTTGWSWGWVLHALHE